MSAPAIRQLAEFLKNADPTDEHALGEVFERIRSLRAGAAGPTPEDCQRCLEAAGMLVGYLQRMGELGGEDVRAIAVRLLRTAADAAEDVPAPVAAAGSGEREDATALLGHMMLGQLLLKRGAILEEHIHQALKVQRVTYQPFGEILVKIGACTQEMVAEALTAQAALRKPREEKPSVQKLLARHDRGLGLKLVGEVMLGELLIQMNVITRRQLERALEIQKRQGLRIGEALVKIGATTMSQIEHALRLQGRERRFNGKPPEKG